MQMQQQRQSRKNRKSCNYQESDDPSWNAGVESQMVQRTMEWNRLDIYRLIQEYHSRTLLWDPEDEEHKCRKKRLLALAEISETIGIDQTECEKKMRNLVSQFQREVKKMKTDLTYTSKWFAYEPMLFLENKKKGEKVRKFEFFPKISYKYRIRVILKKQNLICNILIYFEKHLKCF